MLGRYFRPRFRQLLSRCTPESVRFKIFRNLIQLPGEPPDDIIFKIAETQAELEQAFGLLHDSYVRMNLMDPHPSGMRVTKYHALPSTATVIALRQGKVIGTISVIRNSSFGISCELVYDLSFLKRKRARVAEISALAVSPEYSHQHRIIMWPLMKFTVDYAINYFGIDYIVMIVHPRWFEFYKSVMFFVPFTKNKMSYAFVKGAPGRGGYLNLRHFRSMVELTYDLKLAPKNLAAYLFETSFSNFHFPKRNNAYIADPVMTPGLLDYFFNQKTSCFQNLSEQESRSLHALYNDELYQSVLPAIAKTEASSDGREKKRFEVSCDAKLIPPGASEIPVANKSVSLSGITALMHRKIRFTEEYVMLIDIGRHDPAELLVVPVWMGEDGSCGFAIAQSPPAWTQFIDAINAEVLKAS